MEEDLRVLREDDTRECYLWLVESYEGGFQEIDLKKYEKNAKRYGIDDI